MEIYDNNEYTCLGWINYHLSCPMVLWIFDIDNQKGGFCWVVIIKETLINSKTEII